MPCVKAWLSALRHACEENGRRLDSPKYYKKWCKQAGSVQVQERYFRVPLNNWPDSKEDAKIGLMQLSNLKQGLDALSLRPLMKTARWSRADYDSLLKGVLTELADKSRHGYWL